MQPEEPLRPLKKLRTPQVTEELEKVKSSDTLVASCPGNKKIPLCNMQPEPIVPPEEFPEQALPKIPKYSYIPPAELNYRRMLAQKRREEEEAKE